MPQDKKERIVGMTDSTLQGVRENYEDQVKELEGDLIFIREIADDLETHNIKGANSGVVALACQQILKRIRERLG